ncbi:ATP-binding protein [Pectobacterium polaris]|uniref:ATP-binding protein n=1 Tax=Pectobacterium polaris TaxID=2042057 RepID=UPI000F8F745D|nr:ATP-binding protein [Pectobacterium polaris]RUS00491.1 DNA mismatch repair protein MutL [Pectobacterium polaris]
MEENVKDYTVTYEDRFLFKEIGSIATKPDIAITEIIANSHDAGATTVNITIPEGTQRQLIVEDNGIGLTKEQFESRWLKLRYDRNKHQGPYVECPLKNNTTTKRLAFGRNGVGRHAGLCFDDIYEVSTWRDSILNTYKIKASSGQSPIKIVSHEVSKKNGHGTIIRANISRNSISADEIKDVISARFLFNPEFKVFINGKQITLSQHPGIVREKTINPVGNIEIKLTLVDSSSTARNSNQHGVAFWLGGRLLGQPSWSIGKHQIIDGRKAFAKRYTLIAESSNLFNFVEPDWSGFKSDFSALDAIAEDISKILRGWYIELANKDVQQTKLQVIDTNRNDIQSLPALARKELNEFLDQILNENPDIKIEMLELAFRAAINLEKSRSGISLLKKLSDISSDDVDSLNSFLQEWNVTDAMTILAEIDSRIKLIEAIERLSKDHSVDELHTLHPLIEKARWIFGPEFDTPEYSSNRGLIKTMESVFKKKYKKENFINASKRPDIVVGENSSISILGLDEFENDIKKTKKVLLIELKKGGFGIGRTEMDQAKYYVEDIWHAGIGSSHPFIKAFVVGDFIEKFTGTYQAIGENETNQYGEIKAITYGEMVRTAEARLFALRDKISTRYDGLEDDVLLTEILSKPEQKTIKY